jgi:hypothetical protein
VLLFSGCATIPVPTRSAHLDRADACGRCAVFFSELDEAVAAAGVIDAGSYRVKGYPYLRANRFLASFRGEVNETAAFRAWVERMQAIDRSAREMEVANIPSSVLQSIDPGGYSAAKRRVIECGEILKACDLEEKDRVRKKIAESAHVPDEYIVERRILGVYPAARLFLRNGAARWRKEARNAFSLNPPQENTTFYEPAGSENRHLGSAEIIAEASVDSLGIPVFSGNELGRLFEVHAPLWEVETKGSYDLIGTSQWSGNGGLSVDTRKPATFTRLSFTRFRGRILTQLNYVIWFPARPKTGPFDLYGGLLDGVNLRVTLDTTGEPILYETIHNCGCFYKAYPTRQLRVREDIDYAEHPLILRAPTPEGNAGRLVVSMQSRTHYVQHLYRSDAGEEIDGREYRFFDYDRLRSLHRGRESRRSMFAQNSIAFGSQRLERFLLWPSGILSPGAMRQWGRHATAFTGDRHFDDPFYMEKMFTRRP